MTLNLHQRVGTVYGYFARLTNRSTIPTYPIRGVILLGRAVTLSYILLRIVTHTGLLAGNKNWVTKLAY